MIKKLDSPLLNYLPVTDIANKDLHCGYGIIITFHSIPKALNHKQCKWIIKGKLKINITHTYTSGTYPGEPVPER